MNEKENIEWLNQNGFSLCGDYSGKVYKKSIHEGHFTVVLNKEDVRVDFFPNAEFHLRMFSSSGNKPIKVLLNDILEQINVTMVSLRNIKHAICQCYED